MQSTALINAVDHSAEQANFRMLVADIAWFGLAFAATSRFLQVYAIRLGASAFELGLMAALPSLMWLGSSLFSSWWARRYPNTVQALRWPTLGMRLVFFLPMLAPLFPAHLQVIWLVVAVTATAIPQGVANVLFMDMLRKSMPNPNGLTSLLARRLLFFNIMVAAGTLGYGLWLEAGPFPVNYVLMFAVAFGAALLSYRAVMKVRIPDTVHVPRKSRVKVRPLASKPFRQVLLVAFTTHMAITSIAAVIPLRLVQELGAGESYMAVYGMVELGAAALISLVGARAAQKLGSQGLIAVGMIGTAVSALLIATSSNLTVILLSAGLAGASWTLAAGIGLFRYFSDVSPAGEGSVEYTTMYNQSMGIAMFVGPMLGSALVTGGLSLVGVLMVGAGLRLVSAVLVRAPMRLRRQAAPVPAPALQVQQQES
jgi:MFS family permease